MKNEEQILEAFHKLETFNGDSLRLRLHEITEDYKGKVPENLTSYNDLYNASLIIKKASAQINEMVHAFGILSCLPKILQEDEKIEYLSLASGAAGKGIDLVTNHRIAEFKFSTWQKNSANGLRKRGVFANLVSLYLEETPKKKELYIINKEFIRSFLTGRSLWKNELSKHESLKNRLTKRCEEDSITGEYVSDIFTIAHVELIDINNILH